MWDPEQYLKFSSERDRPFFDLLARVPLERARTVADLGCGDGHLTAHLAQRFPGARVWGVDRSGEMLAHAPSGEHLRFVQADLRAWEPPELLELSISSAALQWVPDHPTLLPTLARWVAPGGVLAFQVPANVEAPSHTLLRALLDSPRWRGMLVEHHRDGAAVLSLERYVALLHPLGFRVEAWQTEYLHLLQGQDAVLEWVRGTALRPVLSTLPTQHHGEFLESYRAQLARAYPPQPYGTPFPFLRRFVVARREG